MRNWIAKQGVRRTEPEYELRDAVEKRGCPICRLMRRTSARQLDIISYEAVNDIDLRARLRAARGFCPRHAWQFLEEIRDPLGIALIYRDIINTLAALVTGRGEHHGALGLALAALNAARPHDARWLTGLLAPTTGCAICAAEADTADLYLGTLARELAKSSALVDVWIESDGLCWPHLLAALAGPRAEAIRAPLVRPWLRRFGADAGGAEATTDPTKLPYLIAAVYGSHAAPRAALPADLIVDVQRRHLATTERPHGEVAPDCVICKEIEREDAARRSSDGIHVAVNAADYCAPHAWERHRSGRGSPEFADALATIAFDRAAALEPGCDPTGGGSPRRGEVALARWRLQPACPTCASWREESRRTIERLLLEGTALAPLCLGHQLLGLSESRSAARVVSARGAHVRFWRELSAELAECIRKHDYRFRDEPRGSEQSSPWRAVDLIAGPHGVF